MAPQITLERKAELKGQILEAAFECFATTGYDKTKMDDVAAKSNVSKGTLYLYFKNKEDLYTSICENSVIRVREELSKVFVGKGAFEEQVSQVFTQLRKKMAGSEAANFEMLSESMRNPKMRKIMYNQRKRLRELVTEFLTGFANKKLIRKDLDIEALASGFLAMYDGLMVDVVLGFPDKLANGAWKATSSAIVKGSSPKVK